MSDTSTQQNHYTTIVGQDPRLSNPVAVAFDSKGNLYVSDRGTHRILKISSIGEYSVFAGTGTSGFSGDGGPATIAQINAPCGIVIDSKDNVYFADAINNRIRRVGNDGNINTFVGSGKQDFSGDGDMATAATLNFPQYLGIDDNDNIYVVDAGNCRIRKIDSAGRINTVAGNGASKSSKGDGGPATKANLLFDSSWNFGDITIAVDGKGNIYICEIGEHRVRKVNNSDNTIRTFAGGNGKGTSGDGGPATEAKLSYPYGVAVDRYGTVYIADADNHRIQKVDSAGIISTIAGKGADKDDDSVITAPFYGVQSMNFDHQGNLYVVETDFNTIRKISLKQPSFTIEVDNPFSVIAVISPETTVKKYDQVDTALGKLPVGKIETEIATGNIISKFAPYQSKAGGWQFSLVADPLGQDKGIYLSFSVHSKAGKDGKVNHCEVLAPLKDNYIINTKDKNDDTTEQQSSETAFKKYTHTVAAVKDKGVIKLYLNGKRLSEKVYTGSIDISNSETLNIGKLLPEAVDELQPENIVNTSNLQLMPENEYNKRGIVRKASLWNKALSQTEIINYTNSMMDPVINFPLTIDYQVLYDTPKQPEQDFTIQIKGTVSLSVKSGQVFSESFDNTQIQTFQNLKLLLGQKLYPGATLNDLGNFTFKVQQDANEFKGTITATHPATTTKPLMTATDTFPNVNDGVHMALYNKAIDETAQKLIDQANQGQNEVVYQYDKSIQQVYAKLKVDIFSDCAGFWNFYGPGQENGVDFSSYKNNVPSDQRTPPKPLKTVLPFLMEEQALTNWCWAATSLSVSKFYDASKKDTQCNLATRIFQNPLLKVLDVIPEKPLSKDQSFSIEPPTGNYTYYLQEPLQELNLSSKPYGDPLSTLDDIDKILMSGQPIGIRIKWTDNDGKETGGHFAVLSGHYSGEAKDGKEKEANSKPQHFVVINDPFYGMSFMQWGDSGFAQKYQGTGTWSHTYNSRPVWIKSEDENSSNKVVSIS